MTWVLLGLGCFVAGALVGWSLSVASSAAAREIERLGRQWLLR